MESGVDRPNYIKVRCVYNIYASDVVTWVHIYGVQTRILKKAVTARYSDF